VGNIWEGVFSDASPGCSSSFSRSPCPEHRPCQALWASLGLRLEGMVRQGHVDALREPHVALRLSRAVSRGAPYLASKGVPPGGALPLPLVLGGPRGAGPSCASVPFPSRGPMLPSALVPPSPCSNKNPQTPLAPQVRAPVARKMTPTATVRVGKVLRGCADRHPGSMRRISQRGSGVVPGVLCPSWMSPQAPPAAPGPGGPHLLSKAPGNKVRVLVLLGEGALALPRALRFWSARLGPPVPLGPACTGTPGRHPSGPSGGTSRRPPPLGSTATRRPSSSKVRCTWTSPCIQCTWTAPRTVNLGEPGSTLRLARHLAGAGGLEMPRGTGSLGCARVCKHLGATLKWVSSGIGALHALCTSRGIKALELLAIQTCLRIVTVRATVSLCHHVTVEPCNTRVLVQAPSTPPCCAVVSERYTNFELPQLRPDTAAALGCDPTLPPPPPQHSAAGHGPSRCTHGQPRGTRQGPAVGRALGQSAEQRAISAAQGRRGRVQRGIRGGAGAAAPGGSDAVLRGGGELAVGAPAGRAAAAAGRPEGPGEGRGGVGRRGEGERGRKGAQGERGRGGGRGGAKGGMRRAGFWCGGGGEGLSGVEGGGKGRAIPSGPGSGVEGGAADAGVAGTGPSRRPTAPSCWAGRGRSTAARKARRPASASTSPSSAPSCPGRTTQRTPRSRSRVRRPRDRLALGQGRGWEVGPPPGFLSLCLCTEMGELNSSTKIVNWMAKAVEEGDSHLQFPFPTRCPRACRRRRASRSGRESWSLRKDSWGRVSRPRSPSWGGWACCRIYRLACQAGGGWGAPRTLPGSSSRSCWPSLLPTSCGASWGGCRPYISIVLYDTALYFRSSKLGPWRCLVQCITVQCGVSLPCIQAISRHSPAHETQVMKLKSDLHWGTLSVQTDIE